jgi:hypothetical protein
MTQCRSGSKKQADTRWLPTTAAATTLQMTLKELDYFDAEHISNMEIATTRKNTN